MGISTHVSIVDMPQLVAALTTWRTTNVDTSRTHAESTGLDGCDVTGRSWNVIRRKSNKKKTKSELLAFCKVP